jgi:2-polyprenyl-6-hydroxyphenyl methylase/3-demethylubiquinone-9 3-methyltransferase
MFGRFRPQRRIVWGGDKATSDQIYASGGWDKLSGLAEVARYGAIGAYCAHLGSKSVLDVGCGEGILAERLPRPPVERYVGVDFSPVAVELAKAKNLQQSDFVVGDAQVYTPSARFDLIVFNEVLYYLDRPEQALTALAAALEPDGAMILSVFRQPSDWVWKAVNPTVNRLDGVTIQNGDLVWDLALVRPLGR